MGSHLKALEIWTIGNSENSRLNIIHIIAFPLALVCWLPVVAHKKISDGNTLTPEEQSKKTAMEKEDSTVDIKKRDKECNLGPPSSASWLASPLGCLAFICLFIPSERLTGLELLIRLTKNLHLLVIKYSSNDSVDHLDNYQESSITMTILFIKIKASLLQ
jgi:hypothetical protein